MRKLNVPHAEEFTNMVSKKICKTHHQVYGAPGCSEIADEDVFLMTCHMKSSVRSKTGKKNGASNSAISEFKALFFLSDTVVLKIEETFGDLESRMGEKKEQCNARQPAKALVKTQQTERKYF